MPLKIWKMTWVLYLLLITSLPRTFSLLLCSFHLLCFIFFYFKNIYLLSDGDPTRGEENVDNIVSTLIFSFPSFYLILFPFLTLFLLLFSSFKFFIHFIPIFLNCKIKYVKENIAKRSRPVIIHATAVLLGDTRDSEEPKV